MKYILPRSEFELSSADPFPTTISATPPGKKYCDTSVVKSIPQSSSSCHAGSTDIPDPLSPLLPIVHRLR